MSQTWKKITVIMLILCLLTGLWGCGQQNNTLQSSKPPGTVMKDTETHMTIIDQAGREVTVKKDTKSIALCYRVVIRFLLSLEQGDKIKGIGKTEDFLEKVQPSLKNCDDVGQGVVDIEAMAKLNPDLFIHKANDVKTLDRIEELGIPAVGIDVETPKEMITALDILGKVCGAEKKAEKLIRYYYSKLKKAEQLTENISQKKTAIVMGSQLGDVADGSMLQSRMIQAAGAINPAAETEASELWPTVGTEQIFQWNPEYIFITGSENANYTPEDILSDPAWSELKAVKKKQVYAMPAEEDSWEFPGVGSVLGIDFMIKIMYPSSMTKNQLEHNVNEFYKLSYGKTFSRKELGY